MVGAMCKDGDKASAPASPGPKGLRDMRRLLRRPPRPRSIDYDLRRPPRIHPHLAQTRSTREYFRGSHGPGRSPGAFALTLLATAALAWTRTNPVWVLLVAAAAGVAGVA